MRLSTIIYAIQGAALVVGLPSTIEKRDTNTSLQYYDYPGPVAELAKTSLYYSQAVRVGGNTIMAAGQGGWLPDGEISNITADLDTEIARAFANVDLALKTAGGQGWPQVYKVHSYHVPLDTRGLTAMVNNLKMYMPDSEPIWTAFGVTELAQDEMHVEIEVEAWDPQS